MMRPESMHPEPQRVVVIQDASREVSTSAILWALPGLSLKPGDEFILLSILHQVNTPMGYKVKVDSSSMFRANNKIVEEALAMKKEEYKNHAEIRRIINQCQAQKVSIHTEVLAGHFPEVAINAVKNLKATWVILDRHMKKDCKYFLEGLSCGLSRMRRDHTIEHLRVPNGKKKVQQSREKRTAPVKYEEMIPGSSDEETSPKTAPSDPASSKASSSSLSEAKSSNVRQQDEQGKGNEGTTKGGSFFFFSEGEETSERQGNNADRKQNEGGDHAIQIPKEFSQSTCSVCKNRRPTFGWKRDFTFAELQAVTEGFSDKNFLSEGGFGSVYKGEINGMKIAVKQHKSTSLQGEKEFKSEVEVLSKARHENLVMLLGSCSDGNHRLLVYEYVCNGSLDQHLSQYSRTVLTWEDRMKIAIGVAKGLQYLHDNNIIHRDMRPNNILVTHNFKPLVGDFGLALERDPDHSLDLTRVVGTLGYLAPEYAESGKVSTKTDVYSFGVVLLQLITGLKTTDKRLGGKSLVGWARPLLKERNYPYLIDERITHSHDFHQLFWMVRVAEKCLSKDPKKRLSMTMVVNALSRIIDGHSSCELTRCSPARTPESVTSVSDSPAQSEGSDEGLSETNGNEESLDLVSSSLSSMNQLSMILQPSPPISTASSSTNKFCHGIPPSPPMLSSSSSSIIQPSFRHPSSPPPPLLSTSSSRSSVLSQHDDTTSATATTSEKARAIPRNKSGFLYGDMLP